MNTRIFSTAAILLLATACTTTTTAARRQFDDISVPSGLVYQPGDSIVIEAPTVKAAQLVYRGRLEPMTLSDAMRTRLEASGWRQVSRTTTVNDGMRQVYEKDGGALDVHIYEGLWYTYLELSTSQVLPPAPVQTGSDTPPAVYVTGLEEPKAQNPAKASASLDPGIAPETQTAPAKSDPSFTQRVKDFFTNLFTW
jgi:hypothetical protein